MKRSSKGLTVFNYVISGIFWLLGILAFLFGLLGPWHLYHLAGFGFIAFAPVALIVEISVIIYSCREKDEEKKFLLLNLLSLGISVALILLAFFFL